MDEGDRSLGKFWRDWTERNVNLFNVESCADVDDYLVGVG